MKRLIAPLLIVGLLLGGLAGEVLRAPASWASSLSIFNLGGVLFTSLADKDFFIYDSASGKWKNRTPTVATANLIVCVGDSGSGGTKGLVPAAGSGDAAAGKFLKADCTFAVPAGSVSLSGNNVWTGSNTFAEVIGTVTVDSTTSRTLAAADCGTTVSFTNGSAVAVTVPNSLPVGCSVALSQDGAGQITVSAGSGATAHSPHSFTKSFAQYSIIGIAVITNSGGSSAVYNFVGDGAT